ncbi:bifunctional folylpolyglutamate synthase/dihydrofolate synthase [Aureimonas fodinaquatilis]|uniref:Dihydrofolate synthase/folylpolyglutamate synthase n=1 Tax=Aureimonas fodinaquatilis TaxID=2565783 RepID=A0A5B0DST9_9HYPH|nr:folylpolyglutamate synthase/dihydrofolate synthase family protein [Aureimonas fodinaquatilis]KAA0968650.1 bifunctional folylpolyglutamate synthase/dihydrofolate synthase [Aureimonas fodinaquatilis]
MTADPLADAEITSLMLKHPKGFDLALTRIRRLLAALGDPQNRLPPVLHIAGTNGKGSTIAFARAILEAGCAAVHVHTSPHLVSWRERYRLGRKGETGQFVEDEVLAAAIRQAVAANGDEPITVFEILTSVTFLLFSQHPADAVLLEVGLGGRFDATNVIDHPAVSVVSSISLDHQAYLGDRVELIAAEKAGIFKPGVPAVIGHQPSDDAREVLRTNAERTGVPPQIFGEDFIAYQEHGRFVYQDQRGLLDLTLPAMIGRHQLSNAALAIAALRAGGFDPSDSAIEAGVVNANWPGRMQRIGRGRLFDLAVAGSELWLDGGHNPGAGIVVAEAIAEMEDRIQRPLFLIAGMLNTKEPIGFFEAFAGMARHVFTVPITSSDAGMSPDELADAALDAGLEAEPCDSVEEAIRLISTGWQSEPAPRILICGSLYLVGDVLKQSDIAPV